MRLLRELWSVLTPRQRHWALAGQGVSLLMACSTVIGIASIAPFFAALGNPALLSHSRWLRPLARLGFGDPHSLTVALGLGFLLLVLFANLINVVGSYVLSRLALRIGADLQANLFAEYIERPLLFHRRTHSAILFNNVVHETSRATNGLLQNAFGLVTHAVTAALIVASIALLNAVAAAVLLVALAGSYALIYLNVRTRLLRAGQRQSECFVALTRTAHETFGAIAEIMLQRAQPYFAANFARSSAAFARAAAVTQLIAQMPRHLLECVAVAGLVGIVLWADHGSGIGASLGQLTFLGFAVYRLLPTLQQAFMALVRMRADQAAFLAIAPDLRAARSRCAQPVSSPSQPWPDGPRSAIRLERVSFRYEPDAQPVIREATLQIPPQCLTGLIGASGSGKSTLMALMSGLLTPDSGLIEIDGTALDETTRAAWQAQIAYVPQEVFLLDTTIAGNIALGVAEAQIDSRRVRSAASIAQLEGFIATLPEGYAHPVGERGARLSGGQRQRIGIARALYRRASVLILDEATNALDGLTEQELMRTLGALRGHCTIILVAHRLGTVRACDLIFELDAGRVGVCGSYEQLVQSDRFRGLMSMA